MNIIKAIVSVFKKSPRDHEIVPSDMTPRKAIEIALSDIKEQLRFVNSRVYQLRSGLNREEAHQEELCAAESRMLRWLESNPE